MVMVQVIRQVRAIAVRHWRATALAALLLAAAPLGCRPPEHFDPQRFPIGNGPTNMNMDAGESPGTGGGGGGGGWGGAGAGTGGEPLGTGGSGGRRDDDGDASIDVVESPEVGASEVGGDAREDPPSEDTRRQDVRPEGSEAHAEISSDAFVDHCDRAHWTATASVWREGVRAPANAIDGDLTSRWGTGRNQDGTDWYQVDFGGLIRLSGVTLNNTLAFPGDYPGGYAVYGSPDGAKFVGPFATGEGTVNKTVIQFAERTVRAVQIKQTGTNRGAFWWQIAELQLDCSAAP